MTEYSIQENIVNISMKAAELIKDGKIQADDIYGHAGMTQDIVRLAKEFEKQHEDEDWNLPFTPDYWEEIDRFAEEQLMERYGIEHDAPENTVSLWARVGVTLDVPQETYARLKAGDRTALMDVLNGRVGQVRLDGETYFPHIDQNIGLEDMGFQLPPLEVERTPAQQPAITNNDPVKVYAVAGTVKNEIYSGTLDKCKRFCEDANWTYLDENEFEWSLELDDTRDLPKGYFDAVVHFSREDGVDIDSEHTRVHASELVYCFEQQKSLLDYDFWCCYESLLGDKLSFEEYVHIDSLFDGDPQEVNVVEDQIEIVKMEENLARFRANQKPAPEVSHAAGSLADKIQAAESRKKGSEARQESENDRDR